MSEDQFRALCNVYGFAPSRALRELIDCAVGQARTVPSDSSHSHQPVAWQWMDSGHFRKKIPAGASPEHWRPLYAKVEENT